MSEQKNKLVRRRLARSRASTILSISLVLLLVGVASLLLVNARALQNYFKENMKVGVMLRQEVTDEQAEKFDAYLSSLYFVKGTEYISREQGIKEMSELLGEDFLRVFETSPVPASFDVAIKAEYVQTDSLAKVKGVLEESPYVDEVVYQDSLVDALNQNMAKISLVLAVLIILLLFISFVLISNTVRLSVFSRRFTIHTMNLVGATRGFIRRPFLLRSILQGLIASVLALIYLALILYFIKLQFPAIAAAVESASLVRVAVIVVGAGVLICLLSTYFMTTRLLAQTKDELYS